MAWDPDRYERFADHRARPGVELISRIPQIDASTIVDLGCGTGHLTALLGGLWEHAAVTGVDSSIDMIDRARSDRPSMDWLLGDIASWEPDAPVDIIFSNAALHWLEDHEHVFRRLRSLLAPGGVLAVQMPDNWQAPDHTIPGDILDDGSWPEAARRALLRDPLSRVEDYRMWVQPSAVDIWRTTYYQELTGEDPVWTWVTGSFMRPVLAELDDAGRGRMEQLCRARYRIAFPPSEDGTTMLPFTRLFIVARAPDD